MQNTFAPAFKNYGTWLTSNQASHILSSSIGHPEPFPYILVSEKNPSFPIMSEWGKLRYLQTTVGNSLQTIHSLDLDDKLWLAKARK